MPKTFCLSLLTPYLDLQAVFCEIWIKAVLESILVCSAFDLIDNRWYELQTLCSDFRSFLLVLPPCLGVDFARKVLEIFDGLERRVLPFRTLDGYGKVPKPLRPHLRG